MLCKDPAVTRQGLLCVLQAGGLGGGDHKNLQKSLFGLQTAAKCGNITIGYEPEYSKRSDGESRFVLCGKERSFTG